MSATGTHLAKASGWRARYGNRVALLIGTALDYRDEGPGAARLNGRVERRGRDSNSRWASDP